MNNRKRVDRPVVDALLWLFGVLGVFAVGGLMWWSLFAAVLEK